MGWRDGGVEKDKEVCSWPPQLGEEVSDSEFQWAWEDMLILLGEAMKELDQEETAVWHSKVLNFGWRGVDGYSKVIKLSELDDAGTLLSSVLPHTQCHFRVYKDGEALYINNAHHDSPVWKEWYILVPLGATASYQTDRLIGNHLPSSPPEVVRTEVGFWVEDTGYSVNLLDEETLDDIVEREIGYADTPLSLEWWQDYDFGGEELSREEVEWLDKYVWEDQE